jgi:hypothetical protein
MINPTLSPVTSLNSLPLEGGGLGWGWQLFLPSRATWERVEMPVGLRPGDSKGQREKAG